MSRHVFFPARPGEVAAYASRVIEELGSAFDGTLIHAALAEALLNGIVHGALGVPRLQGPSDLAAFTKRVRDAELRAGARVGVTVEIEPSAGDEPAFATVRDPGTGFDWRATLAALDAEGEATYRPGGLRVIRAGSQSFSWNEAGNELRLELQPLLSPARARARTMPPSNAPERPRTMPPSRAPSIRTSMRPPAAEQREPAALSSARPPRSGGARARVLVADDVETNQRLLELLLGAEGYEVECVGDGITALERVATWAPHVAILDAQLPGMGALEVAERMAERGLLERTSLLVATASPDDARLSGPHEFLRKPISRQELVARVQRKVAERRGPWLFPVARDGEASSRGAAARLMEALTPASRVAHGRAIVDVLVAPCSDVGGDLVDVVPIAPSACAAVLLDVAGRGLTAALAAAETRAFLRERLADGHDLGRALAGLNDRLAADAEQAGQHVAFVIVIVDDDEGIVSIVNAGCPPVAVWARGGIVHLVRSAAPPAGVAPHAAFPLTRFDIENVERVVAISDGLASRFGEADDTLGALGSIVERDGLTSIVRLPRERAEEALARVGPGSDDAALMWITVAPSDNAPM